MIARGAVLGLLLASCSSSAEDRLIAEAQERTAETLRDPDSARFSQVRVTRPGVVCGQVNGKNAFGAYAGAEPFVYIGLVAEKRQPDDNGVYLGSVTRQRARNGRLIAVDFTREIYVPYCG